jgi:hypothetical protein
MATDLPPPNSSAPGASDDDALRCPACDYDLRALAGGRCPECGLAIDRAALSQSQIPWAHRARIGRFRAYRKTVWMVFRHPKKVAADSSRPVSLEDARKFRRVTVILTFLPLFGTGVWGYAAWLLEWLRPQRGSSVHAAVGGSALGWVLEGVGVAFAAACLLMFLFAATGVASYFFHPRGTSMVRQNRAVPLSYYACAPLAWTTIPVVLFACAMLIALSEVAVGQEIFRLIIFLETLAFLAAGVIVAGWWRCSVVLLREALRCSVTRVAALGLTLPISWAMLGLLTLGVLPAVYLFFSIVILSLRH